MRRPDHHLYPQVDWNQVESGKYAVVDPNSVADILYLTPREYVITSRVAITSDMVLVVLATPRDDRPKDDATATPSSDTEPKNSPPRVNSKSRKHHWLFQATDRETRFGRIKHAFESRMLKFADQEIGSKRQLRTTRPGAGKSERANPMIAISQSNLADLTQEWANLLWFRFFGVKTSRSFSRSVKDLSKHLVRTLVHQGALTLVLRLKIILHCVLAYVAGNPMQNTQELGMRVKLINGLPACLPSTIRLAIRSKNVKALRLWISVLNFYRGLKAPHPKPKFGPITAPRFNTEESSLYEEFAQFCRWKMHSIIPNLAKRTHKERFFPAEPYVSSKKGPNGEALKACRADLIVWMLKGTWDKGFFENMKPILRKEDSFWRFQEWLEFALNHFTRILYTTELGRYLEELQLDDSPLFLMFQDLHREARGEYHWKAPGNPGPPADDYAHLIEWVGPEPDNNPVGVPDGQPRWTINPDDPLSNHAMSAPALAKLVCLYEPAGKVRNIVTFDWWSQWLLRPVHQFLMNILKDLPCDATFDQDGAVKTFSEKKYEYMASLDLRAATEWIPQELYKAVLIPILGTGRTEKWMSLLTARMVVPVRDYHGHGINPIRYNRGQPMGALSSWPSMALVHHVLVQFSAFIADKYSAFQTLEFPFRDYMILGDDIIIANEKVAESYKKVCTDLGVKIGLPKSYISHKGFGNFAAQSFLNGVNLSPISISEEIVVRGPAPRVEQVLRFLRRGFWSLGSAGWLAALLRFLFHEKAYKLILEQKQRGIVSPLAQMAFMAVFGVPGRVSDSTSGIQGFSAKHVFGGINLGMSAFSMPFEPFWAKRRAKTSNVNEILISSCLMKAKELLKLLVPLDKSMQRMKSDLLEDLAGFFSLEMSRIDAKTMAKSWTTKRWFTYTFSRELPSGDVAPLTTRRWFSRLFSKKNHYLQYVIVPSNILRSLIERLQDWEKENVPFLNEILSWERTPFLDAALVKGTFGHDLPEVYHRLCKIEQSLVISLEHLVGGEVPVRDTDPDASIRSFDRLLRSFEHLCELAEMPSIDADSLDAQDVLILERKAHKEKAITPRSPVWEWLSSLTRKQNT
jgi:hypothetical protein